MPPREDAEGLVINYGHATALKIKQADYLTMHRIVTNTSAISIWEAMAVNNCLENDCDLKDLVHNLQLSPERVAKAAELGSSWEEVLSEGVPDEFHDWLKETASNLRQSFRSALHEAIRRQVGPATQGMDRRETAQFLQGNYGHEELPWNISMDIFANDGRLMSRPRAGLWRHVRPHGARWGMNQEEENA